MIIVAVVVLTALMGWGDRVTRYQRIGLCVMASGLILAAPSRYMQGVGLADLMFLSGIATTLIARHWRHILQRADRLDGVEDGRIEWPQKSANAWAPAMSSFLARLSKSKND